MRLWYAWGVPAPEDITLRVLFDGSAPALVEHRLSLSTFAEPLEKLLRAFRRIASGIVTDALGDPQYGRRGGRLARQAESLDLEIVQIGHGCVELAILPTIDVPPPPPDATLPLFPPDLLARTANVFLDALDAERRGELRNVNVREYLRAVQPHVRRQKWTMANRRGETLRELDIQESAIADVPESAPYLDYIDGTVVGVGFAPGPLEVRMRADGTTTTLAAKERHVDKALASRGRDVHALVVRAKHSRLLWMRAPGQDEHRAPAKERIRALAERWDGVLRRLAK